MSFFDSINPAARDEKLRERAAEKLRKLKISQDGPDARIRANDYYAPDMRDVVDQMYHNFAEMVTKRYNSGLEVNGLYSNVRDNTEEGENGNLVVPRVLEYDLQGRIMEELNLGHLSVEVHATVINNGLLGLNIPARCMVVTVNLMETGDLFDNAPDDPSDGAVTTS